MTNQFAVFRREFHETRFRRWMTFATQAEAEVEARKLRATGTNAQVRRQRPAKRTLAVIVRRAAWIALASALATACATDPAPLPTCADLGAPAFLLCNSDGVCRYDGMECTASPRGSGSGSGVEAPPVEAPPEITACDLVVGACLACDDPAAFRASATPGVCAAETCHTATDDVSFSICADPHP